MAHPYDFKTYQEFIAHELESPRFGHGARTRLATHLGVQKSLVSMVLTGTADFSMDQGFGVATFLDLNAGDRELFFLMMGRDRASTPALKNYYRDEIARRREEREQIKSQITDQTQIEDADYAEYTGAWHHAAVHVCIRNPALRDAGSIAAFLKIDPSAATTSLQLLERIGFAKSVKGRYLPGAARINVSKQSPALRTHHMNWRVAAARALDEYRPKNLHYTLQLSIDSAAVEKIRKILLESVKSLEPIIAKAEDEEVYALNLDLFRVGR